MESLYILIPLSVALVLAIGAAFWRALHGGQFDDLDRPAHDIIADDDRSVRGMDKTVNVEHVNGTRSPR